MLRRYRPVLFGLMGVPVLAALLAATGAAALLGMLHLPRRQSQPLDGARPAEIRAADGAVLKGSWLAGSERCVLFLHGVGGERGRVNRFLPALRADGYAVLSPDSRAHGESGGDTITFGLLEKHDAIAWTRWLRQRGCARLYGLGESMGASVLIEAAALEPAFAAIVADSPYADLLDEAEHRAHRLFPLPDALAAPLAGLAVAGGSLYARTVLHFDFNQASPERSLARARTPVLLIHGAADNRTPPSHSERLAAASPETTALWLVPGAGHVRSFRAAPDEYSRRMLEWFRTH
jgi:fermentation-respiration switch protein FrsA (DUF1100 family)